MPSAPTPETTLAILIGASKFPKQPQLTPSKAFSNCAAGLKEYFLSSQGLALPAENVLDLFDSDKSADAIDEEVGSFLDRRQSDLKKQQLATRDVVVYYVGHGGFSNPGNAYFLALRSTRAGSESISSYGMTWLASTLREHAPFSRKYLILDSCFSAAAQASFQSAPLEVAKQQTLDEFPDKGISLLCAAGPKDPAKVLPKEEYTMFSGALLDCLRKGSPEKSGKLSLMDVGELTRRLIKERFPDRAVRPELHSPDQKQGEVATLPFFPNPASGREAGGRPKDSSTEKYEPGAGFYRYAKSNQIRDHVLKLAVGLIAFCLANLPALLSSAPITSIGALYYEAGWAHDLYIVFFIAISSFLLVYRGHSAAEFALSKIAALAGFGVVLFPCGCGSAAGAPAAPYLHYLFMTIMFIVLTCFCIIFYRRAHAKGHRQASWRSYIYVVCAITMMLCIAVPGIDNFTGLHLARTIPLLTFHAEWVFLVMVGISWLVASKTLPLITKPSERISLLPLVQN